MKKIKEMTDNFKPDMLPPREPNNVRFFASPEFIKACEQFGAVYQSASPEKCHATGKGLERATPGELATAVLHIVNIKGNPGSIPIETVACELVSDSTGEKTVCSIKKKEASQYEVSYQPASRGRHELHIKVEGEHIKGSPFPVTVKLPIQQLGTPIKTIIELGEPWGVDINQRGDIVVAEYSKHCISIFSQSGEKLQSFGAQGTGNGQFEFPAGLAVDDDGSILVADRDNHRIQKFTPDGEFITAVGKEVLEISYPVGIAIHPESKKIYIAEFGKDHVHTLNPDLTFSSSLGCYGSDNGQFFSPHDVAFDSIGNVYVADAGNNRIQVFTPEGEYLRQLGKEGSGKGELIYPTSISIDSDDVMYVVEQYNYRVSVFTCDGNFLISFGTQGSGPGKFNSPNGIAVDKNGLVYVSDMDSDCLQIF